MAIKTDEPIKLSTDGLEAIVQSQNLITELYDGIDSLNGHLTTLVEMLPKMVDESNDADVEAIVDFYRALPVWSTMDVVKEALESIRNRAEVTD